MGPVSSQAKSHWFPISFRREFLPVLRCNGYKYFPLTPVHLVRRIQELLSVRGTVRETGRRRHARPRNLVPPVNRVRSGMGIRWHPKIFWSEYPAGHLWNPLENWAFCRLIPCPRRFGFPPTSLDVTALRLRDPPRVGRVELRETTGPLQLPVPKTGLRLSPSL